ncbi:STY4851/ECs_5259 family protein [Aeromonas caviae]|nr:MULTISPECIES: STY4851/ECs_5259 family protein [Aeromonas]MCJ7928972.1 STY4851/ECs_5259 family protein [Aeromonas sp. LsrichE-8G]MCX4050843.1 STY4851/ECs_5259 family protein [Aeromonas caviae]MCX4110310.1 STY4851/ECs_5259 family protein [Aeromonas caviae]MDX7645600.1 STY4851/ECs_5259 family protein [Aeromonas caviae]MDX7812635.1 STY4851/ECs_5259 family protein [Aeromonas caviae]
MQINQWISEFLARRGLKHPDERPLFAYKTSTDEFESLKRLLQNYADKFHLSRHYPAAWLLFAAEWWKRDYAGGAWRWGPLCEAAGLKSLSHDKIRNLVIDGHQQWCLQTSIKTEGKRFIGLVAMSGGLPMRLVESAQGGLARLLRMVTEQALHYNLHDEQLRQAVEAQAALLPVCYQQSPVYELLDNLIKAVLHIRATYELHDVSDPIGKLQKECPDWEDIFPITLDSQAAASLIKGLVRSVVSIPPLSRQTPFQILKGLRLSTDGSPPQYELSFIMQAQANREHVANALGFPCEQLPPHFQLVLRVGEQEYMAGEALLRGDKYQLIAKPLPLIQALHDSAQLIVSRWGATLHIANLPGGEELSHDEPLIFENTPPFARLIAQGDARLKGSSALVAIPPKTIVFSEEGEAQELCNNLSNGMKLMELPAGDTRLVYQRQTFRVHISSCVPALPDSHWTGNTIEATSTPGLLFCGTPRLRVVQESGYASDVPSHELFASVQNSEQRLEQTKAPGLCRLIWRKDQQRLLSTRAVILPPDAGITYKPGISPLEGIIRLVNWPNLPVRSETEEIELKTKHDGSDLILDLKSNSARPVTSVPLSLQWPGGEQKLTLPFPAYGVTLLRNNTPLENNQVLTIGELVGCRAILMSAQGAAHWRLRLSTIGLKSRTSLSQEIKYIGVREIRLFELIPKIQQMLSCHPRLDHTVLLELIHGHQTHASLEVGRYSTRICLENHIAFLSDNAREIILEQTEAEELLQALPLAEPERDPVNLPLCLSEQAFTGNWQIDLPEDAVGPWLIYTNDHTQLHCRPTIAIATAISPPDDFSPLRKALCEADSPTRMSMLRTALQLMAADPENEDWLTLEQLLDKLHHLPLASLDICQALIREPLALAMATLLLDNFSSRMAERLPSELPFEWLLIAPEHWFSTFTKIRQQLPAENSRRLEAIRNDIQSKSHYLARWQPALSFIFEQGFHQYFGLNSQDVSFFFKNPLMLIEYWLDHLFDGENSAMQQMFRRNPPETQRDLDLCHAEREELRRSMYGNRLLDRSKLPVTDFKLGVVIRPFMAAFDVYAGKGQLWQSDPARLFSLRTTRQLDTVWFDAAYQTGLAMAQTYSIGK